jgi:ribose/xylose/arabinose/galactoside ABC-type transport system permease subunit
VTQAPGAAVAARPSLRSRAGEFREAGMLLAVVATAAIFAILAPRFLSVGNVANIASQISFLAILAVSMTFVIISGEIDLSIGSMVGLAAVVFGLLLRNGVDVWLACALTLVAGTAMGLLNGALSLALKVPSIIITLGMLNVYRGAGYFLSDGYPIADFSEDSLFFDLGQERLARLIPYNAIVFLVFAIACAIVLRRSVFGHRLYAMGSNFRAARLAGIRTDRIKLSVLALNGFAAAIAALLTTAQTGTADPNIGIGYELDAIAAVIIGGAALTGGSGTVLGSVLGMLLIGMIRNGLVLIGVSIYLLIVVSGLIVIIAVAANLLVERRRRDPGGP